MTEPLTTRFGLLAAAIMIAACVVASIAGRQVAISVVAGSTWNLASLWCLTQLLQAWLGLHPSRRRVIGWLLVKFPLLYLLIFLLLRAPFISAIGFGVGFSIVLIAAVAIYASHGQRVVTGRIYGR